MNNYYTSNQFDYSQKYNQGKKVATILGNPEKKLLNENEINSIIDILQANGAIIEDVEWLNKDVACDIFFSVLSINEVDELLKHLLADLQFDYIVQKTEGRKKKLLISDMDSTIIEQECIDELANFAGLKNEISVITERAMNGELDFKESLRERVSMLKGLSEKVLEEAFQNKITMTSGAKILVQTMRANGAKTILVSGGFTFFSHKVSDIVGFEVNEANILEIESGKLTGKVKEPILDKQAKLNSLIFHCEEMGIPLFKSIAVGDGANDLPMLLHSGISIAYKAKKMVKDQANASIDSCDLTALLYVQGYKYEQFNIS